MTAPSSSFLSRFLIISFFLTMLLGTGPGTLLVNRAVTIKGIPLLYLWGIVWYLVLVAIALIAYFRLWKSEADQETTGEDV